MLLVALVLSAGPASAQVRTLDELKALAPKGTTVVVPAAPPSKPVNHPAGKVELESCENLRFEAQDFICTLEAKLSGDAAGTPAFNEALKRKIACQNSFLKTCQNEIMSGTCETMKFEAQDFICTLESKESEDAAGTPSFKKALQKKLDCQSSFLKTCHRELPK